MSLQSESRNFARVLMALSRPLGHRNSIDDLESKTGLDRNIIRAAIDYFRESQIDIEEGQNQVSLNSLPDIVLPSVILCGLKSRTLGCEIHAYKSIGSTNEVARRLADSGALDGVLVISERQTRGRGRLGRTWHSPGGLGLYFSLVLRPRVDLVKMPALSLVAALSLCRAMEGMNTTGAQIKWPNDCLLGGKKVAGILVDLAAEFDKLSYAVLGIGINVNQKRIDFPMRLRSKATSLLIESGQKINRPELLRDFLLDFEKSYLNFQRYGLRFLGPELARRSAVLGRKITVNLGKKRIKGEVIGFDPNGALRLRVGKDVEVISGGEVTLR